MLEPGKIYRFRGFHTFLLYKNHCFVGKIKTGDKILVLSRETYYKEIETIQIVNLTSGSVGNFDYMPHQHIYFVEESFDC